VKKVLKAIGRGISAAWWWTGNTPPIIQLGYILMGVCVIALVGIIGEAIWKAIF
jgi:hypothetical protein